MRRILLLIFSILMIDNASGMECHGTEPFWSAKITKERVELDMFMIGDASHFLYTIESVEEGLGFTAGYLQVFKDINGPVAVVQKESCNDGMSDFNYKKEVIIFGPYGTLLGCCDRVETE